MKKKYQEAMLETFETLVEINNKERDIQAEFTAKRVEEVKPICDDMDAQREELIVKVAQSLAPEIRKMIIKLGLQNDKPEVREAFKVGISAKILEMFENHIRVGAIEIDEELRERMSKAIKEV